MKNTQQAFTLVELVIVIIILGVLSSIGFVSYTNYISGSRDANRVTQIKDIYKGLQLYTTTNKLPIPDSSIDIVANVNFSGYQGEIGENILKSIGYTNGGIDPKDKTYLTYRLSHNKKNFQIITLFEEKDSSDLLISKQQERYPYTIGSELGIFFQKNSIIPVHQIDTIKQAGKININSIANQYDAVVSNGEIISGDGNTLFILAHNASCKRILQSGDSKGSRVYTINGLGLPYDAYCDMETDGGGWTFFGHFDATTTGAAGGLFFESGIGSYTPTRADNNTTYSINASQLGHTEMMVTLDEVNVNSAKSNSKIVFYKYNEGATGFYTGPIPCVGLVNSFSYKINEQATYTEGGTSNSCSTSWYTRTVGNTTYLTLFGGGSVGNYWGSGMGGNNTWGHDGWWYVR